MSDQKRPYLDLKWIVENCDWQYNADRSEMVQAHLAAINILKARGVENAKRKPLSNLSKKQRQAMRKQAKQLAALMQKFLGIPVSVTRSPIKTHDDGRTIIQIAIARSKAWTTYLYPSFEELQQWAALDEPSRMVATYKIAERFKGSDRRIRDNLETIRAQLDCLLD